MEACYHSIIERSDDGHFHLIQIKAAWPARRDAWAPQNITDHTMPRSRAIVWMDSHEASVFRFGADEVDQAWLRADNPSLKVSHKAGSMRAGRPAADFDFFDRVIDSLRGTRQWHLAGPDGTKQDLVGYLEKYKARDGHIAELCQRLAGVCAMARPTDDGLLERARS